MLLLSRPPYLRWVAAALIVVGAVAWDLSDRRTVPYPFAATDIVRGAAIDDAGVEWRDVPAGSLSLPSLAGARAAVAIAAGDPIIPSVVEAGSPIPDGWWSIPMRLPHAVGIGTGVRLVLADGTTVDGVVTAAPTVDPFGVESAGAVAVAPGDAERVARHASLEAVVVLVAP